VRVSSVNVHCRSLFSRWDWRKCCRGGDTAGTGVGTDVGVCVAGEI